MTAPRKIGEMNGRWAALFKVVLVVVPTVNALFIPWAVWVTTNVWRSQDHMVHADELHMQIEKLITSHTRDMEVVRQELKEVDRRMDELPSAVWREKIATLELDMKQNASDHTQIKVALEQIKAKLGIPPND